MKKTWVVPFHRGATRNGIMTSATAVLVLCATTKKGLGEGSFQSTLQAVETGKGCVKMF